MTCKYGTRKLNDDQLGKTFQVVCETHNWGFPLGVEVDQTQLCPIGQSEKVQADAAAELNKTEN